MSGVMVGVFAALVMGAAGEEVKYGSELTLRLATTVAGGKDWRLQSWVAPEISMKNSPGGILIEGYRLGLGYRQTTVLDAEEAEGFADLLERFLKGFREDGVEVLGVSDRKGNGIMISDKTKREVRIRLAGGEWFVTEPDACLAMMGMVRQSLRDAEKFLGAWEEWEKGGEEVSFAGMGLMGWRLRCEMGMVQLKEIGTFWVRFGKSEDAEGQEVYYTTLAPMENQLLGVMPLELLEALAKVPSHFEDGTIFRWETAAMLLRAFPENKAIVLRPDLRRKEDVRIHVTAALEARRMIKERDRLQAWLEKEGKAGFDALVEEGDGGIFGVWK